MTQEQHNIITEKDKIYVRVLKTSDYYNPGDLLICVPQSKGTLKILRCLTQNDLPRESNFYIAKSRVQLFDPYDYPEYFLWKWL